MIVVKIGHQDYVVEALKDAEQLLEIFSRATPVDLAYSGGGHESYYHPDFGAEISIKVTADNLVTEEEHQRRKAQAKNKPELSAA